MEKQDKINIMKNIIVETMVDNYRSYGQFNAMSESEVQNLIDENLPSIGMMAEMVSEKIYLNLFN